MLISKTKKFPFLQDEVDYVGLKVTKDAIIPTERITESIWHFPEPRNITDAKAFLGLIEQVSYAFSKCDDMVAFRHLISPKVKFL